MALLNYLFCDMFGGTVEPLWKGQESLTKVAKFGQFQCTIFYKSCLFYLSWQATSFERPPFWLAFIKGFHCILECYELTHVLPYPDPIRQSGMSGHCYTIGCVIKSTHGAYVVVVQLLTFLKLHFIMEWLL